MKAPSDVLAERRLGFWARPRSTVTALIPSPSPSEPRPLPELVPGSLGLT
jgi:hypothetical protein